jgi:glycosyltransferase involved in cell wall biosynthesis
LAEPTVSAVILAFENGAYIGEAVESAMAQTHPCDEVIVIDNGSTDEGGAIAAGYGSPVSVHRFESNRGIGLARNAGLEIASGEHVAFLDGDDTWEPRKTELQLAALEGDDAPDMVFGHVRQFASPDLDPGLAARIALPEKPQPGLFLGAMLAPRPTWDQVGPWDRGWDVADGLAWLVRARSLGLREAMLPEVVANRRVHGANQSFRNHEKRGEWARLLKASLDERRKREG